MAPTNLITIDQTEPHHLRISPTRNELQYLDHNTSHPIQTLPEIATFRCNLNKQYDLKFTQLRNQARYKIMVKIAEMLNPNLYKRDRNLFVKLRDIEWERQQVKLVCQACQLMKLLQPRLFQTYPYLNYSQPQYQKEACESNIFRETCANEKDLKLKLSSVSLCGYSQVQTYVTTYTGKIRALSIRVTLKSRATPTLVHPEIILPSTEICHWKTAKQKKLVPSVYEVWKLIIKLWFSFSSIYI